MYIWLHVYLYIYMHVCILKIFKYTLSVIWIKYINTCLNCI